MLKRNRGRKRTAAGILLGALLVCLFLLSDCANIMRPASGDLGVSATPSPANPKNTEMTAAVNPERPSPPAKERTHFVMGSAPGSNEVSVENKQLQEKEPLTIIPIKAASNTVNAQQETNDDLVRGVEIKPAYDKVKTAFERAQPVSSLDKRLKTAINTTAQSFELNPGETEANAGVSLGSTFTDPTTGMEFILVKGGCFQMGADNEQAHERPVHEVCVADFYMGKHEVTQQQWKTLMGRNASYFQGNRNPVEWITWDDSQNFIRKISDLSGRTYRLPTEAEWEYAARSGGRQEKYAGTSDGLSLRSFAWYDVNSNRQTHAVGLKKPNGIGLHDMSGNVWEWCSDWYGKDYYTQSLRDNPQGPSAGKYRVIRGGEWGLPTRLARATYREAAKPGIRRNDIGFRLVLAVQ